MIRDIKVDRVVNVRGLSSPHPNIIIIETLKKMGDGEALKVVGAERGAVNDIKSLCRKERYCLLEVSEKAGRHYLVIEK